MPNLKRVQPSKIRKLTVERLRELLDYCPETGVFARKKASGRGFRPSGKKAGGVAGHDYVRISVNGSRYYGHHLAWLHYYGSWPERLVDHVDGNGANNAIKNLRYATSSQNLMNANAREDGIPGVRGISKRKDTGAYTAYLNKDGKRHLLGCYPTLEEAIDARVAAEEEHFSGYGLRWLEA